MEGSRDIDHWTSVAPQWIAWARTPNHDAFWAYQDQLKAYVGTGTGAALDVGCGEGRVSRALTACGYTVTAVDPVPEFVEAARQAQSARRYAVAPAGALPFEDGGFDLVMAYNVLMDVDDVPGAVREMKRVLRRNGTMFISVVHPLADLALMEAQERYFDRRRFSAKVEERGLAMHFAGWAEPLEAYARALESAGLAIVSLREPSAAPLAGQDHLDRWTRLPLFLWIKARNLPG